MRCTNCGWENPDGAERCEKCNSPLAGQVVYEPRNVENHVDVKSTVPESQAPIVQQKEDNTCPSCGFPIREGSSRCPNCGQTFGVEAKPAGGTPFIAPAPIAGVAARLDATVNPWSNPNSGLTFKLQPIAWDGEQGEIPAMSYTGKAVELKRDNTDPANNTITSKTQAAITSENGKWFIEDKSAQQSTFVHAGRKIELTDGDVVILGNRRFIFKAQ